MSDAQEQPTDKPEDNPATPNQTRSETGVDNRALTPAEREAVFVYWCNCDNLRQAAREALPGRSISPTTIYRIMREDKWSERRDRVLDKVRKQAENQAARAISNNLESARQIAQRVVERLLDKKIPVEASVSDFIRLAEYIDSFEGTAPSVVAAELLNDALANITAGKPDDQQRILTNMLAGLGISDRSTVSRATKVLLGKLSSQN